MAIFARLMDGRHATRLRERLAPGLYRPQQRLDPGASTLSTASSPLSSDSVATIRERARDIAEAVLEAYWTEGTYPVDPVKIASRVGVETFAAQLGNDVFGMLVKPAGAERAQIFLDSDQPSNRFRFTAAHELGHYVERGSRLEGDDLAFIDKRSDDQRGKVEEIYANEFAGNLLMPRAALEDLRSQGMSDFQLAARLGVSIDALNYRYRILGFH
jgi:hypothetical protein